MLDSGKQKKPTADQTDFFYQGDVRILEKTEILEILNFMKIVYQGRKIDDSDETIATWQMMFDEYSKNEVLSSIKRLVKKSKYVPSIHEILEEAEKSFTVERMVRKDCIIIHVRFHDQLIPFKFKTKDEAMKLIEILRGNPSREDIMLCHEQNTRLYAPFAEAIYINQSDRDEFEKRKRTEYFAMKLKEKERGNENGN